MFRQSDYPHYAGVHMGVKKKRTGDWLSQTERDRYRQRLGALKLTHRDVADTYGCRRHFVSAVLLGIEPCPFALRATLDALTKKGEG